MGVILCLRYPGVMHHCESVALLHMCMIASVNTLFNLSFRK